jgi:hypothetical protein
MTTYIEYSVSAGHGTLVEHGAEPRVEVGPDYVDHPIGPDGICLFSRFEITPERYAEFISIHGGERAV